jgi:hypothetical protein
LTTHDRWVTREELDAYLGSPEYRLFLTVIDLSLTPPDISFDHLEYIGGLDLVQALRAQPHMIRTDDVA